MQTAFKSLNLPKIYDQWLSIANQQIISKTWYYDLERVFYCWNAAITLIRTKFPLIKRLHEWHLHLSFKKIYLLYNFLMNIINSHTIWQILSASVDLPQEIHYYRYVKMKPLKELDLMVTMIKPLRNWSCYMAPAQIKDDLKVWTVIYLRSSSREPPVFNNT